MLYCKRISTLAYWAALIALALYVIFQFGHGETSSDVFHQVAYYLPSIAALFVVSLQLDYLDSIARAGNVNIKARMIDFMHWLMLVSINVSTWLVGQVTIWWLLIQLVVLVVIGVSVGIGLSRKRLILTTGEKTSAIVAALVALALGFAVWGLRSAHLLSVKPEWWIVLTFISMFSLVIVWWFISGGLSRDEIGVWKYLGMLVGLAFGTVIGLIGKIEGFDYGWWMDTLTSVVAITLVSGFIIHDIAVFRRDHTGYPRELFLKGIFGCNILIFLAWLHALLSAQIGYVEWMLQNLGFTFVTLVGNAIYAYYYVAYEYYRFRQTR